MNKDRLEEVRSNKLAKSDTQKSTIEAVGIDRAESYQAATEEYLPQTDIVYDRFHLMLNVNEAINKVRRGEWKKADNDE